MPSIIPLRIHRVRHDWKIDQPLSLTVTTTKRNPMSFNFKYVILLSEVKLNLFDIDSPPVHSKINENGRIVIPAELRQRMGVNPGDPVVLTVSGGVLRIESYRSVTQKIQESMRKLVPDGRSLADEWIAERREEYRRENPEFVEEGNVVEAIKPVSHG